MPENFVGKEKILGVHSGLVAFFTDASDNMEFTPLVGRFNALNVNASVLLCDRLGLSAEEIKKALKSFEPAFGRGEVLSKDSQEFYVFLAKNPASFNNNLQMLLEDPFFQGREGLLFILNDNIPDGRDVSWIYDIEPDLLFKVCAGKSVYVSGTRNLDMQIRLNYAGVMHVKNLGNLVDPGGLAPSLLDQVLEKQVVVLPNYSAMLEFRKLLTGKDIL